MCILCILCIVDIIEHFKNKYMPVRRKNITLKKEQADWVEKNAISLSKFVQKKIDEEMKKERHE
jgi:hypothetical protein